MQRRISSAINYWLYASSILNYWCIVMQLSFILIVLAVPKKLLRSHDSKSSHTCWGDMVVSSSSSFFFPWMASWDWHENGASTLRDHPWRTALVTSQFHSDFLSLPRSFSRSPAGSDSWLLASQDTSGVSSSLCVIIDRFRMNAGYVTHDCWASLWYLASQSL